MKLPSKGTPKDGVLSALSAARSKDANWRSGRTFSLVYFAGDEVLSLLHGAFEMFFSENALNPMAFPSLRRFETEVISMTADLLSAPEGACGSMTSGGSESILMAVKTARDFAREKQPNVHEPEMVLPITVHPAFEKAAHYFGVKPVHVPVTADFRADVDAMRAAITDRTILLVGSAPAYPHGVIDPIREIAALAQEKNLLCHVDACLGGLLLPFVRKLGYPIRDFDFAVPGVTSMSADLHKYGYAAKGASTVLYRTRDLRRHQFTTYTEWPGGLYGSPTMTGTRAGGPIAAAWAVLNYLGEEGYLKLARTCMETARAIQDGIGTIDGLRVLGKPDMTVFAFTGDDLDVYRLADEMDARGWHLDRQQLPPSLHLMITPAHQHHAQTIVDELRSTVASIRGGAPAAEGSAAMYGMLGSVPDRGMVRDFVFQFLDSLDAGS